MKDWSESLLYQRISQKADSGDQVCKDAKQTLDDCMPDIQKVLQQGDTAATDFTLHDDQHGFRVAQRMADIVGELLNDLSGYELALLLLSAYLHDIGMTPEKGRVRSLYHHLLIGEKGNLSSDEIEHFRRWLDIHGEDFEPPLAKLGLTGKTLGDAEWLIAHYCRERHNDWSGEWIETYFTDKKFGHYTEWVHDLIVLCKSHHYGFEELVGPRFNPVEVGSTVVHLRYLAAVLRLADVMEIDPERTPEVVLRQRDVDPSSLIYWSKDHGISLKRHGMSYRLEARPRSALFHKAIADTAQQIEQELQVCYRLANETAFDFLPGSSTRLPYRWDLSAILTTFIEPLNKTYEYIDGTFRPDVRRLLKLLSGVELYGNELAAVRELLQNAFDAVRERIACERLINPDDQNRTEALGKLYEVVLSLEQEGDAYWLICRDPGAGMSKGIIRDHLLVSGASRRDDLLRLQRRCERAGFPLERTARFGIGVLSYFMIADQVHIHTRRCQSAADCGEGIGWSFVTDGLNGFGELKRDPGFTDGTEVRLRVKRTLIGNDPATLWQRIITYVKEALTHIPCRLRLKCVQFPESDWSVGASGWVREPAVYAERSLSVLTPNLRSPTQFANLADNLEDLVPGERFSTWRQAKDRSQTLHDMAHRGLRWSEPVIGNLPDGLGRYRFFFPWFELDGGPCFHFFEIEEVEGVIVAKPGGHSGHIAWVPWCPVLLSWFGVRTDHELEQLKKYRSPGVIEIDWISEAAGKIEVSRNRILPSEKAEQAVKEVVAGLNKAMQAFAEQNAQSRFALYNCALTDGEPPLPERWYWLCQHERKPRVEWRQLSFPVVAPFYRDDSKLMRNNSYRWRDQNIPRFCGISGETQPPYDLPSEADEFFARGYGTNETWYSSRLAPHRVVLIVNRSETPWGPSETHHFGMLWEYAPIDQDPRVVYPEAQFPLEWANLCLFMDPPHVIWNRDHRLVRAASRHGWKALMASPCKGGDPRPFASELSSDSELAAAWLLFCLSNGLRDLMKGVAEHSSDLIQSIWQRAFGVEPPDRVWAHIADSSGDRLVSINPRGWNDYVRNRENTAIYAERLAIPGNEWCVYGMHQEDRGA